VATTTQDPYVDLRQLLTPGFLSTTVNVGGHRYGLKSLSHGDLFLLDQAVNENDPTWKLWIVAHSLWVADGIFLLEDVVYAPKVVFEALSRSNRALISDLFGTVLWLFRRVRKANLFLEAFLYEEESRRLWGAVGRGAVPLWRKSPVPGLERLGLNSLQSAWMSWNQLEDTREEQEYIWSNTKVMVSLQSHKSYQKMDNRDKSRIETEKGRRRAVIDRVGAIYRGELDDAGNSKLPNGVRSARTDQELADEMRRWVTGDMDSHDKIIADYKDRIRTQQLEQEGAREEALRKVQARKLQEAHVLGVRKPALVGLTQEQMEQKFKGAKPGAKFIIEADPVSRTFNRYLRHDVTPGNLKVDPDGRVVSADMAQGTSQDPKPSLQELIATRKTILNGQ